MDVSGWQLGGRQDPFYPRQEQECCLGCVLPPSGSPPAERGTWPTLSALCAVILPTRHVGSRPQRPATDPSVPALSLPGPAPLPAGSWARRGACQGQGPGLVCLCPGAQHRVCPLEELCKHLLGSDGHAGRAAGLGRLQPAAPEAQQDGRLRGRAGALDRQRLGSRHGRSWTGEQAGPATLLLSLPPWPPFLCPFSPASVLPLSLQTPRDNERK